jgi:hypothetical protein
MSKFVKSDTVDMVLKLTKQPKREKRSFKGGKGRQIPMKELLKSKRIKKYDKAELVEDIISNLPAFEKELKKTYGGEGGKHRVLEDREDIVDLLTNKKFAKALVKALKEVAETDHIPYVVFFAIGDMYVNGDEAFAEDEDLVKAYMKAFDKFFSGKIKKLAKKLKVKRTDALSLILTSISFKDVKAKFIFKRGFTFLNLLYGMEDLDEKKVKTALDACYGKRKNLILTTILNESPKKSENFSIVTNAALSILNKMDRDDLKELLKRYAKRRKQNPKSSRRIALAEINESDYKNINRVIDKLIKTGWNKELFM